MTSRPFSRILLKLSGEAMSGKGSFGIDPSACERVVDSLYSFHYAGIELAVVMGGGNIFRGIDLKSAGFGKIPSDQIGMLATMMNGVALHQSLKLRGIPSVLMSAVECPKIAESYHFERAQEYLDQGKILIFVGGTGNPYFTTDTAAALRASEIEADLLLKATKVEGIYNCDPLKCPDAVKYKTMTYSQLLNEGLQVMDATAVTLCQSNNIPIFVFNMDRLTKEPIEDILTQIERGTWVSNF